MDSIRMTSLSLTLSPMTGPRLSHRMRVRSGQRLGIGLSVLFTKDSCIYLEVMMVQSS